MKMKTIRITYLTKLLRDTDLAKWFTVNGNKDPEPVNGHYARLVDDTTIDMLVPDNFNPSTIVGTVVKPDHNTAPHVFMGHDRTPCIVDKLGNVDLPIPVPVELPPNEQPV